MVGEGRGGGGKSVGEELRVRVGRVKVLGGGVTR